MLAASPGMAREGGSGFDTEKRSLIKLFLPERGRASKFDSHHLGWMQDRIQ
jgi:hypothetical protein